MSLSRQPGSSHDILCLCLLYESFRGNVVKRLAWLLQPVIVLNSVCCAVPYLLLSCCLGMEPVLLTSEYLTLCRPTLQHSGRVRPVSWGTASGNWDENTACAVKDSFAASQEQLPGLLPFPYEARRRERVGDSLCAYQQPSKRTGNCSFCCCWCQPQFCGGHMEANQGTVWTPDWVFLVCLSHFFPLPIWYLFPYCIFFPRGLWQQICVWWTWRGRIFYIHHWWP